MGTNSQVSAGAEPGPVAPALAGFQVEKGFRLEVVAAEPLVTAPVAMAFDEEGRLFVAEMPGAEGSSPQPQAGRIRMLQDTNDDGVFETSTVYEENLPQPSALACYHGGVFVGTAPDLIYLKKSGTAEERALIASGFDWNSGGPESARLSNLNWGLDNRIHGVTGIALGDPFAPHTASGPSGTSVGSQIILEPRTRTVSPAPGPACSGLCFDNWGCEFVTAPSRPLLTSIYKPRYAARNPYFAAPPQMLDVASPATRIFGPAGANARALVLQASGTLPSTWLTSACGTVIYRGNAFPTGYQGNVFVADPQVHIIHRMVLREDALEPIAGRPAEERGSEFLASRGASFRPIQIINGPDGALYVADQQDGGGRGRIYRIVPLGFKRTKLPPLGKASSYDLVAMLSHPNGWQRDTAARLLYERQDPAVALSLVRLLGAGASPLARLHALHTLEGLGGLDQQSLIQALRDRDGRVREQAVQLSERRMRGGTTSDPIWNQLLTMTTDPLLRVRYQLALSLGEARRPEKTQALVTLLLSDPDNRWIQAAVLSSVAQGTGDFFVALASNAQFRNVPTSQSFLRSVAYMIGLEGRQQDLSRVMAFIDRISPDQPQAIALLSSLAEGMHAGGAYLFGSDPTGQIRRRLVYALNIGAEASAAVPVRIDALRLVGLGPDMYGNARTSLLTILGSTQPPVIQSTVLDVLGRVADPQIAPALIQKMPALSAALRRDAVVALLGHSSHYAGVMAALQDGRINPADVPPAQVNLLRTFRDAAVRQAAVRFFGPVPLERSEVMERFMPALSLRGDARLGHAIFTDRCTACHRLGGEGQDLGPSLIAARVGGKSRIMAAVLDPNADTESRGAACVVETGPGEMMVGVMQNGTSATLTLGQPDSAPIVLSRANMLSLQAQTWSLMPTGLEEGLSPQDMADLLEYLMTAQ
jgi:putative membrane-bound dehydrogenase-like protein